jgi:peptidoglycan hydrolase-like protein with peptidoglycan-binding domain
VPPTTTPENPPTVRSGSGGRGGGPCVGNCTTSTTVPAGSVLINVGQVLGASTSAVCSAGDYISAYMRRSMNNNSVEVMKLQYFLKNNESLDVDTTGIFDDKTEKAVNAFQTKYSSEVLVPWGINYPTGYVYITTKNKINSIVCNSPMSYTGVVEYKNNVLENVSYEEPVDIVGSVGLISATSTSGEPNPSPNIASVFGAFTDLVEKFLKDISWYPLLILILIILGTVLISRSIIIKDKKPIKAREAMINGSTAIAVGSVLNVLNTVSFILNPQWFISRTNFGMNWLLFLDIVNISAVVFIALMVPGYFYFRGTKKR